MDNITNVRFKDGDDEELEVYTSSVHVEVVNNGWYVSVMDDDGEVNKTVYQVDNGKELLKAIAEELGIND